MISGSKMDFRLNIPVPRYDRDALSFMRAVESAGRVTTISEQRAVNRISIGLRDGGLPSSKVEIGLTGWGVAAANALKFSLTGETPILVGTNTHGAGGLTFGAAGYMNLKLNPFVDGCAGLGCYIKNTISPVGAKADMAATTADGTSAWDLLLNYSGSYYIDYHNSSTGRVTGIGQTLPGLYTSQKLTSTTQRFIRTTSSASTTISSAGISGSNLPNLDMVLGGVNVANIVGDFSQGTYACWLYAKMILTATEWNTINSVLIRGLLDLGWIT
jgi:hypothetical protein